MKNQKDLFKKDLSQIDGSYTKSLSDNMCLINDLGTDVRVDLNSYINRIIEIIKPAKDTAAKRNFVLNLQKQRSKIGAMMLVSNAFLRGSGLEVL